ncbi:hypothetical protein ACFQMM_23305 [Saliphagus sp. GCM10025308]
MIEKFLARILEGEIGEDTAENAENRMVGPPTTSAAVSLHCRYWGLERV